MGKQLARRRWTMKGIFIQTGQAFNSKQQSPCLGMYYYICSSSPLPDEIISQVAAYLLAPCGGGRASLCFSQNKWARRALTSPHISRMDSTCITARSVRCLFSPDIHRNHSDLYLDYMVHQTKLGSIIVNARQWFTLS